MTKFFRENNKKLLAIFGVVLMIAFVLPSGMKQFSGGQRQLVGYLNGGKKVYSTDIGRAKAQWGILDHSLVLLPQRPGDQIKTVVQALAADALPHLGKLLHDRHRVADADLLPHLLGRAAQVHEELGDLRDLLLVLVLGDVDRPPAGVQQPDKVLPAARLDQVVGLREVLDRHRLAEVGVLEAGAALEHEDALGVHARGAVQLAQPVGGDRPAEARAHDAHVHALGH